MKYERRQRTQAALLLAGFFFAFMLLLVAERWYTGRTDIAEDMTALARIIGTNASAALVFDDEKAGAEIVAAAAAAPNLVEAAIFRSDGTPFAVFRKPGPPGAWELARLLDAGSPRFTTDDVYVREPVAVHERVVGSVVIRASQGELYANLLRFLGGYVLIAAAASVITILATLRLRGRVAEAERLFNSFFSSSQAGMLMIDGDFRILRANRALADGSEADAAAFVGRPVGEVWPSLAAELVRCHATVLETGARLEFELNDVPVGTGGARRDWLVSVFPVPNREDRVVAVGAIVLDISLLKKFQAEVERSRALIEELGQRRERLIDEEHKRLAIEIHDELGQILTAALMRVRLLGRMGPGTDGDWQTLIGEIDGLLNDAYRSMKDIAATLRPAALNFGFVAAAEWLADRVLKPAGIAWSVEICEPAPQLDERQGLTLFRIIQEALSNCVRHSEAATVGISLAVRGDALVLEIADDGKGADLEEGTAAIRFGLLGIRERARAIGGSAVFVSAPGRGFRIQVEMPRLPVVPAGGG